MLRADAQRGREIGFYYLGLPSPSYNSKEMEKCVNLGS